MKDFSTEELRHLHNVLHADYCIDHSSEDIHNMKKSLILKIDGELINRAGKNTTFAGEKIREVLKNNEHLNKAINETRFTRDDIEKIKK